MNVFCHRCDAELPERTRGVDAVLFCPQCSAPQIYLPEHLRPEKSGTEPTSVTGKAPPPQADGRRLDWRVVLRSAGWVALVGAALSVAGLKSLFFASVSPLWVLAAASLVLGSYLRQRPSAWIDAKTGLRVGLVTGLLLVAAKGIALSATGVAARFGTHSMAQFDQDNSASTKASQSVWADKISDPAQKKEFLDRIEGWVGSNEIRAGAILLVAGVQGVFILLFCSLGGAFVGTLRARARTQSTGN